MLPLWWIEELYIRTLQLLQYQVNSHNEWHIGRLILQKRLRACQEKLGKNPQRVSLRKPQTHCRRRIIDCIFAIQKALTMIDNWVSHIPLWSFYPISLYQALTLKLSESVTVSRGCQGKERPPCSHPVQTSKLETSLNWGQELYVVQELRALYIMQAYIELELWNH